MLARGGIAMSNDLDERIKRAARRHAKRSDANGLAKKAQKDARVAFLVDFYDDPLKVIESELEQARGLIEGEAAGRVVTNINTADDDNKVSFSLMHNKRMSVLSFVADPLLRRVRIHSDIELKEVEDLSEAAARHTPPIAELELKEITKIVIKRYVAEFVDKVFPP